MGRRPWVVPAFHDLANDPVRRPAGSRHMHSCLWRDPDRGPFPSPPDRSSADTRRQPASGRSPQLVHGQGQGLQLKRRTRPELLRTRIALPRPTRKKSMNIPAPHAPGHTQTLDVIVAGEALVDIVTSAAGTVEHPGGSPANVAYGLGRLGIETGLLTAIGDDRHGRLIRDHLDTAGVQLLPGSTSLDRTATATARIAADGSASYEFDILWDLAPITPSMLPKVFHTGSIATFLAPGAAAVRSLIRQCHGSCLVTYDPNIRPALLGSHNEAKSIFEDLVPLTDVVKLSDDDALWLYPGTRLEDTAARILGLGAKLAVITTGSSGSLLATPTTRLSIPAVTSEVADTIGAGDSYMSALILGLLNRTSDGLAPAILERIGRTASTAAAITVRRPGANPPSLGELQAGPTVESNPFWLPSDAWNPAFTTR